MITIKAKGSYKKTFGFLERAKEVFNIGALNKYGQMGVEALQANTPVTPEKQQTRGTTRSLARKILLPLLLQIQIFQMAQMLQLFYNMDMPLDLDIG